MKLHQLLFLTLCAMFCASASAQSPSGDRLIVPDVTMDESGEAHMVFSLENTATYNAFQLDIALPEGFRFGKKSNGRLDITLEQKNRLDNSHTAATKVSEDGRVANIIVSSLDNEQIYGNDGELFRVKILAEDGLTAGTYTCKISDIRFTDIEIETRFGSLDVNIIVSKDAGKGDVNGDGEVNKLDVTALVYHLIGNANGALDTKAADVNGDGRVDVIDVTTLIDIVLERD